MDLAGVKVDVLLFTYRRAPVDSLLAIQAMVAYSRKQGLDVEQGFYGNALVHTSRNKAFAAAREDARFILWVDDDMVPQPDALVRLVEHDKPIVSALFTNRVEPIQYTLQEYSPSRDEFAKIETVATDKLIKGPIGVGLAFVLTRRDALDTIREYHLSGADWMDENKAMLDRLHVRNEKREEERKRIATARHRLWEERKGIRIFDYQVLWNEWQLGEDLGFFRRLLRCGLETHVDTSVWVGHMGDYCFGPWDMGDKHHDAIADRAAG